MPKILVTGASGFCGKHLCRYLASKNHTITGTFSKLAVQSPNSHLKFQRLNVTSFAEVHALIQTLRPHKIYHLAAQSVPRFSWDMPLATFDVNAAGTVNILEAVRRSELPSRMVFASSIQVYGRSFRLRQPVSEESILWPENPYAGSKAAAEMACLNYWRQYGVKTVIARVFNHFGTGQPLHFVFSDWCRQIAMAERGLKKPILEVGNLDARRDFLHVDDVLKAYEILMLKGNPGEVYNICYGRTRLLKEYIDFLLAKSRIKLKVEVKAKRLRRNDPPVMRGRSDKIRSLGWKPKLAPTAALEDLLNEWRGKI